MNIYIYIYISSHVLDTARRCAELAASAAAPLGGMQVQIQS